MEGWLSWKGSYRPSCPPLLLQIRRFRTQRGEGTCSGSPSKAAKELGHSMTLCHCDLGLLFPKAVEGLVRPSREPPHLLQVMTQEGFFDSYIHGSESSPSPAAGHPWSSVIRPHSTCISGFSASLVYHNSSTSLKMFSTALSSRHTLNLHSFGLTQNMK